MNTSRKVLVALSGGVDSSTAAALLLEQGFECCGVHMLSCDNFQPAKARAEEAAAALGIKLFVVDLRKDFERVLDYFCDEYKRGRTPNPCVFCNRFIKFGRLLDFGLENGFDFFATGHYARLLHRQSDLGLYAANTAKDQSYALAMIRREVLRNLILPMGDRTKQRARETAKRLGLAEREESQEICFIPDDDYVAVLEQKCSGLSGPGDIVDSSGKVLGRHEGIYGYTIGQRRGLRIAMGKPYYVVAIDSQTNTVVLGPKEKLLHRKLLAANVNWLMGEPQSAFEVLVKIRYNDSGTPAKVYTEGSNVVVEFDEPVSAITAGQLAVFYIKEGEDLRVAGGAWIDRAYD